MACGGDAGRLGVPSGTGESAAITRRRSRLSAAALRRRATYNSSDVKLAARGGEVLEPPVPPASRPLGLGGEFCAVWPRTEICTSSASATGRARDPEFGRTSTPTLALWESRPWRSCAMESVVGRFASSSMRSGGGGDAASSVARRWSADERTAVDWPCSTWLAGGETGVCPTAATGAWASSSVPRVPSCPRRRTSVSCASGSEGAVEKRLCVASAIERARIISVTERERGSVFFREAEGEPTNRLGGGTSRYAPPLDGRSEYLAEEVAAE